MVTSVSQSVVNEARVLYNQGNIAGAWQILGNAGDKYAQGAYQIISQHGSSNPTYVLAMVADANWKMIAGEQDTNQYFMQVADRHINSYIGYLESSQNNLQLPNTEFIESSYKSALDFYGLNSALAAVAYPAVLDNFLGNAVNFTWGDSFDMEGSRISFNSGIFSNITPYQAVTNVLGVLLEIKTQYGTEKAWEAAQAIFGENALDIMLQVTDYMPALSPLALVTYYFSSDEAKTEAILSYFSRFQELPNVNENTLLGLISGVAVESVAADLNISLSALYAKANNTYLADRAVELPNGYSMYLFKDGDRVNITPVDNDANYDVVFTYDPEADNPNSGLTKEGYWGDLLVDITNSSKTAKQALEESPLTSNQPRKAIVTDGSQTEEYQGDNLKSKEAVQNFGGSINHDDYAETSTGSFTYVKTTATTLIDGAVYLVTEVIDSVIKAGEELTNFVNTQVGIDLSWFTDVNGIQVEVANWLASNLGDVISGELSADEAFVDMVEYIAQSRISNYVIGSISSATQAKAALAEILLDAGAGGNSFTLANAFYTALAQMAVQFTLNCEGWDGEDYANAGITIISSALAYEYASQYIGGAAGAAGAAAAAATLVNGLLNSQDYGQAEWVMLGVQTGIATGSAVAGTVIAEAIWGNPATYSNPYTLATAAILTAILALTGGKIVEHIYTGKVYYEGEYGDLGALLNSIYQVQQVEVSDGNGGTMLVDALVATNPLGSTIISSGINHIIGGIGSDVLVGDGDLNNDGVHDSQEDTISGGGGSDYIEGRDMGDNLFGGEGNDHIIGGAGDDIIDGGEGDDIIFGDADNDTILGGAGQDFIHGGGGNDAILGGADRDIILGGGGDDVIQGDLGDDVIEGGAGDDLLDGGAGKDILLGNFGNDSITAGDGDDTIFGDAGDDNIMGDGGNDYINGGEGIDIMQGGTGNDLIYGDADDDYIQGDLGDDNLGGGMGDDTIIGGLDDDYLYGESGDDDLQGGDGDDILAGGIGTDSLAGGEGDDIYVIQADGSGSGGNDIIEDSAGGNDRVYINGLTVSNISGLALLRDGDNLVVSYNTTAIATITDHFLGGKDSVERIEFDSDSYIDLSTLTVDGGIGVASYTLSTDSSQTSEDDINERAGQVVAGFQQKSMVMNSSFMQNLSDTAFEEALRDEVQNTYYNGSGITSYYKNRSGAGGKYTVFKVVYDPVIQGLPEVYKYTEFNSETDNAGNYDQIVSGEKASLYQYYGLGYGLWSNEEVYSTDFYIEGELVQQYAILFDPNGDVTWVQERFYGDNRPNVLFEIQDSFSNWIAGTPETRKIVGITTQIELGEKLTTGVDHLVGSYIAEIINGDNGNDIIFGNGGDDVINGDAGDDWLFGGDGDDEVNGGEGDDTIFGGDGDDTIDGGNGDDSIISGSGDDIIYGNGGADWIDAGAGIDFIYGGAGDDIIYAGDGDDYAEGGEGIDVIYGQGGNDIIYGNEGTDYLYGEEGDDVIFGVEDEDHLYGGSGHDVLFGNGGDDYIYGGEDMDEMVGGLGADVIDGGDGFDYIAYVSSAAGIIIDLEDSSLNSGGEAEGDVITNVEAVYGSEYDDYIYGSSAMNHIVDRAGNDFIYGRGGDDILFSYGGTDYFDGGDGVDSLAYSFSGAAVTVSLLANTASGGSAAGDTFVNIEGLHGSAYNDTLYGNHNANILMGGAGNDTLSGQGGNDALYGEDGDDALWGSPDNDWLYGGNGNDMLNGGTENDTLYGGAGNDILYGAAGNDVLYGDAGNDILRGDAGNDTIYSLEGDDDVDAGDGDDIIYASSYNSLIVGGSGTDTLNYTAVTSSIIANLVSNTASGTQIGLHSILGFERLVTGSGDDTIYGTSNSDVLDGYMGNDTIYAGSGNDTVYGGSGNDTLRGEAGDDTIYGGTGNDTILGGAGADIIDGNEGFNYVSYSMSSAGVTIDLEDNNLNAGGEAAGDILTNIQSVYGSDYDDYIYGSSVMNHLIDRAGNDFIYGRGGDDSLFSVSGTDYFDGGDGSDFLSYQFSGAAVTVSLVASTASGGSAEGDIFVNIENLQGSAYNDFLYGDGNANVLIGLAGNDTMYGYGGNDFLYGDAGNDTLYGNGGDDYLAGWDGNDTIFADIGNDTIYGEAGDDYLAAWEGNDTVYGGTGNDLMFGEAGDDILYGDDGIDTIYGGSGLDSIYAGSGNDTVYGEAGNDYLAGGDGNDTIFADIGNDTIYGDAGDDYLAAWEGNDTVYGGTGNDLIFGEAGDDILYGEDGIDTILGDAGNDTLEGGGGYDYLTGGAGADIFVFSNLSHSTTSARDIITDYLDGTDKIKVTGLAASVAEFSITQSGGNTFVTDLDSSFSFQINGLVTLENSDFIFV